MPVNFQRLNKSPPVITVFPVPRRFRMPPLLESVVVPSHSVQFCASVEYSSVPFQCFAESYTFSVNSLSLENVR